MTLQTGSRLGHYRILSSLGKGGMGEVYRAEDTKLGRRVAIKVLPPEIAQDAERLSRFRREARALAALKSPGIVMIHAIEEADGIPFLAMEEVEGHTLEEELRAGGMQTAAFFSFALPLVDAVAAAHQAGIIHRDLKPANIMVCPAAAGGIKVLDFGLAKISPPGGAVTSDSSSFTAGLTAEGRVLGTVAYMSPEQIQGQTVDQRSDIFALGIVFHEMLTGEKPFQGESPASVISSTLRDEPPLVHARNPRLPQHLGRIVKRCLEKAPERRYQSAAELRLELENLRDEVVGRATPAGAGKAARGPRLAAGALAAAALAVAAWLLWPRAEGGGAADQGQLLSAVPLTSMEGMENGASWSPGGEFLAFSGSARGSADIYVMPLGGEPELRYESAGDDVNPRWSPDGQWIAFLSSGRPGTPLLVMPAHGGPARRICDTGLPRMVLLALWSGLGSQPWSLDGKTILVTRVGPEGGGTVWKMDVETGSGAPIELPPGRQAAQASYSWDGRSIVLTMGGESGFQLCVLPAHGGKPEALVELRGPPIPLWLPGDREIAFAKDSDLWAVDVDTQVQRRLSSSTTMDGPHTVSQDGRLVYSVFHHTNHIYRMTILGRTEERVIVHTHDNMAPRFAPDGRRVAYSSSRTGDAEIWVHDLETGKETRVTRSPGFDVPCNWSPDGRELLFFRPPFLHLADLREGSERQLCDTPVAMTFASMGEDLGLASWSPDGSVIGFVSEQGQRLALWTVQPDGTGASERLAGVVEFDWYRDSNRIIYSRATAEEAGESRLFAANLETGAEQLLYEGSYNELSVAPDGSAVAFSPAISHLNMKLHILELEPPADAAGLPRARGEPVLLTAGAPWHIHNGSWAPDSKSVIYVRDTDYADLYLLDLGTD